MAEEGGVGGGWLRRAGKRVEGGGRRRLTRARVSPRECFAWEKTPGTVSGASQFETNTEV
jgi:hypothetical protein